ncbi:Proton pump-interactor 1 [Apostasia shenzhenica]|uniref:Proton pump-interactor 1 n=1 Tax=Apostasia shenzhenica TaxID=1088818 RepID=A0A2H9ZVN8_9ASPA|nr:Proton pump-interactor 1 [Apostasia shenzhenica]
MAVEASEGGGAGAGGELISKAEVELKKERELGGEFEHIACRDGEENEGSGIEGSFVMVMCGRDSDERSDSSEKEVDLHVGVGGSGGGATGDPPAGSGAEPPEGNSDFSALVDDESVEEGKGDEGEVKRGNVAKEEIRQRGSPVEANKEKAAIEGIGEDAVDNGEQVQKILVVEEKTEQVDELLHSRADAPVAEAVTGETEEDVSESRKTEHDKNEKEEAIDEDLKKDEEKRQNDKEAVAVVVSESLEQNCIKEGDEHPIGLKGENASTEGYGSGEILVIGAEEQDSEGTGAPCAKNEGREACEKENIEVDLPPSTSSYLSYNYVESSFTLSANKEVESVSDVEEMKTDQDDKCSTEKKVVASASEIERRIANDEVPDDLGSSVIESAKDEELGDRKNSTSDEIENFESSTACPANQEGDSDSVPDEGKNTSVLRSLDVEYLVTDHAKEDSESSSEIRDKKNIINDVFKSDNRKDEIEENENSRIQTTMTVHDTIDSEFDSSTERTEENNVDASDVKADGEEKEQKSSTELISEQAGDMGSVAVNEYQIAEASCAEQIPKFEKEGEHSSSGAEESHVEELSSDSKPHLGMEESASETVECKDAEASSMDPKPKSEEVKSSTSEVEENQHASASLVDSNHESVMKNIEFTSKAKEKQDTHFTSANSNSEPVKEDKSLGSKEENNQDVGASVTKSDDQKIDVRFASEIPSLIEEEQDREGSDVATVNEDREIKSASELAENADNHPVKGHREIVEERKELKSEEKPFVAVVQAPQDIVGSSASDTNGEKSEIPVKKQYFYLIKVPKLTQRVIADELQSRINEAQMEVDEKTKIRDFIKNEIEDMRKKLSDYCQKKDAAIEEERKAKALVNAKRKEMDALQSAISKGKAAASFLDIISQIHSVEHQLQHETISLKEEKKYLHDLSQLKHERELHPCNKHSESDIDEALRQKETAESSLRGLKKEFDILRNAHSKADGYAKSATESYVERFNKIKVHEQKWKTANELRQNAYKRFQGLKSDKMEHFWKYMDDREAAKKYAESREIEALERHCMEQVERILQLWNKDDEFRRQYVESNLNSTIRRFRTLDGRTLNPNEEPVILQSRLTPSLKARSPNVLVTPHGEKKSALQVKPMLRSELSSKSAEKEVASLVVSVREDIVETKKEEKLTKEDKERARLAEEQTRKEEELRKEREAAELKEKLRMEQKVKAKEAEERKRRKAEKAQARAEYKAQKESELREQKRVKKEKKKENLSETTAGSVEGDTPISETASLEIPLELELNSKTASKRSANRSALNKYSNRVQPVPFPLRNKGKKKTSTWVWTFCGAAAVAGLFFAGNYISFSDFSLQNIGF